MSSPVPPLNWFRAFESAARHLSFTHAAEEMNVTQSAVSQHVRALEGRLGVALFERKARGLAITEAGRRLQPSVAGAIEDLAKACEMFAPSSQEQTLEIACTTSFALLWLVPRLPSFQRNNPKVHLRLSSTLWPDDYHNATSDLQIRYGVKNQLNETATQLFSDELIPVCTPELARAVRHVNDVWTLPIIRTIGSSEGWENWAKFVGVPSPPTASFTVDSIVLATEFAKAGTGIALVSRILCSGLIDDGSLVIPIVCSAPAKNQYFLMESVRSGRQQNADRFRVWLHNEVRRSKG